MHDHAVNQVILWAILIGVAVMLLIIGIIIATVFGYQLLNHKVIRTV